MSQASGLLQPTLDVSAEDLLRAQVYRLLARFLSSPPRSGDLRLAAELRGDQSPFGQAIATFARAAALTSEPAAADEYHELFIGLVRGELVPYGSYYLTGFLHEKPLARLRADMARLGLEREDEVREPEDHIASLCEIMAGCIDGTFGEPLALSGQKAFFTTHLAGWASIFFRDLEVAKASVLYAALGSVGRVFMGIESGSFAMVD